MGSSPWKDESGRCRGVTDVPLREVGPSVRDAPDRGSENVTAGVGDETDVGGTTTRDTSYYYYTPPHSTNTQTHYQHYYAHH